MIFSSRLDQRRPAPRRASRRLQRAVVIALALGALFALLAAGGSSAAGPTYNLVGTWTTGYLNADGSRAAANGTWTVTSMNMSTGAYSGTAVIEGVNFVLVGTETGAAITQTLSEGGYVAHDTLTLSVLADGNIGGNSGTFTGGTFWAELTSPTGTTTSTSTSTSTTTSTSSSSTTTQTTSTGASLDPTATAVQCDFYVASANDICTATVGDSTGNGSTPTGQVGFSGDRTGACSLQATPSSPGVANCSITVTGSETNFLNITAAYAGDATHAASTGSTQFLTAAPGNGVFNPTIETFNPQTLTFTEDNPVSGSTLTGQATLTGDGTAADDGQSCPAPESSSDAAAMTARRVARATPTITVSHTIRRARKGRVAFALKFNVAELRKLFPGTHTLTLAVTVTITPPHGLRHTFLVLDHLTLRAPAHGRLTITRVGPDLGSGSHAAAARERPAAEPRATGGETDLSFSGTLPNGCGTLKLTVTIPPPTDANRLADTTATVTGHVSYTKCGDLDLSSHPLAFDPSVSIPGASSVMVTVGSGAQVAQVAMISGKVSNSYGDNLTYAVNSGGGALVGTLATTNVTCPAFGIGSVPMTTTGS